ncbi:MAG: thiosulfate oxidation carrier complex protein SoxZ [Gammaproteobacteria bacterium]|nr:MAG: thiosulfate oxidation carrier complex protein SoxZ [Gammaproteobacteria bacterium]
MASIKIRARTKGDETTVKALITHVMETGLRKGKDGKKIPAHHITEVTCEHAGQVVMTAQWGPAVSKNPYLAFKFKGAKSGDMVKLSWVDNKGKSDSIEAKVK